MSLLDRPQLIEKIHTQHIIVDSNFWIEAYNYPKEFKEIFAFLSVSECEIITLHLSNTDSYKDKVI